MNPGAPAVAPTGTAMPAAAVRWVALGDSFTAGVAPGERTWTTIVAEQLAMRRPTSLLNLARIGARTSEVEREQLPRISSADPTLITLICGANDIVRSVRPDLGLIAADLERLLATTRGGFPEADLLTATYPAIGSEALRQRTRRRIRDGISVLNSTIRKLAPQHGAHCVELADHPGQGDVDNYAEDGIHPSPAGHRAAAEALGSAIERLLTDHDQREETR